MFEPSLWHCVEPVTAGTRYSLVLYTSVGVHRISEEGEQQMISYGFPIPPGQAEDDPGRQGWKETHAVFPTIERYHREGHNPYITSALEFDDGEEYCERWAVAQVPIGHNEKYHDDEYDSEDETDYIKMVFRSWDKETLLSARTSIVEKVLKKDQGCDMIRMAGGRCAEGH